VTTALAPALAELERDALAVKQGQLNLERELANISQDAIDARVDAGDALGALRLEKRRRELPAEIADATAEADAAWSRFIAARDRELWQKLEAELATAEQTREQAWAHFCGGCEEAAHRAARYRLALIKVGELRARLKGDPNVLGSTFSGEMGTGYAAHVFSRIVEFMAHAPHVDQPQFVPLSGAQGDAERAAWNAFWKGA
jgi:hypothetical protein